jgi:hypothetical protein
MSYPRGRARALGLALMVVLGLMALGASGAQGNWLILHNGQTVESKAGVVVTEHTHITILVSDSFNTLILCKVAQGDEVFLGEKSTLAIGTILLNECTTYFGAKSAPNCDPVNQPVRFTQTFHLTLHNSWNYIVGLPAKASLAIFEFGELCALGEEVAVTGTIGFECGHLSASVFVGLDCKNHQVIQLLRLIPVPSLLGVGTKFGANSMGVHGILAWRLDGLFTADKWGGHV